MNVIQGSLVILNPFNESSQVYLDGVLLNDIVRIRIFDSKNQGRRLQLTMKKPDEDIYNKLISMGVLIKEIKNG